MKIALVSLGVGVGGFSQFTARLLNATVALYYIGKILEDAGFEVKIFDQPNNQATDQEVFESLKNENPRIILFAQFFSTREKIRSLIQQLRAEGVGAIVGVGGHDATFHSRIAPNEYVMFDAIFQGPVLGTIVNNLKEAFQGNGQKIFSELWKTEDPNLLPVLQHDNYLGTGFLVGSVGCLRMEIGCGFCTTPIFSPEGWRGRSIEDILQEAENLYQSGKTYIFLSDDDSLMDLNRGHKIIMGCREIGLEMMIMTKPKYIVKAEEKGYVAQWNNVKRVFLGVENGSHRGLCELGKNTGACTVESDTQYLKDCIKAFEILKAHRIAPFTGHINFTGSQTTLKQLRESSTFLCNLGECDWTSLTQAWRPYPGTPKAEMLRTETWIEEGELRYKFNDIQVDKFHRLVQSLRSETDQIDNALYSVTDEMYIRNPEDPKIWNQYRDIKGTWNNLSYEFFMKCSIKIEWEMDLVPDDFLRELPILKKKLNILLKRITKRR
ncbi:MAG: hypothetical protein UT50_C0010G0013 [Candidatus Moranbacteria bacterium GW2011_GWA2_39_41]|nr:MAG: hypothetical protein UT50_C0010G0013 [Candidatus Moranbacteria bacterium GW2011_GWA2_39_41]